MLLLFSGEGASDVGGPTREFAGPIALMACQVVENFVGYCPLQSDCVNWIPRTELSRVAKTVTRRPKTTLPGAKSPKEILHNVRMAEALGLRALELEEQEGVKVVAVLFHDSDGTCADGVGRWRQIVDAICYGFGISGFSRGVPMVPRPKQEAWFLCALKDNPYQACEALEYESGNDSSPNNLKKRLEIACGKPVTLQMLNDLILQRSVNWERLEMPSFKLFVESMSSALSQLFPNIQYGGK